MVESTCFQHTSSHPDKYNNSVDRIISKEEEREDPRRDSSIYLQSSSNPRVFPVILQELQDFFEYSVFYKNYSVSTRSPAVNSIYRINSTRNTTTTRLIPCRLIQGIFQHLFPMSPSILHSRIRLPASLQYSRAT